jgi:SAM-dependent methyltransferase
MMISGRHINFTIYLLAVLLSSKHSQAFHPNRRKLPSTATILCNVRGGDDDGETSTSSSQDSSRAMYNKQATNWVRTEPRCLSDFTGRPVVFDMLADELSGSSNKVVLDVGCGEGYCARKVIELGASKVVGCDISQEMIASAQSQASDNDKFYYYTSPVSNLLQSLKEQSDKIGIDSDGFDIAIAVFLFNYLTTDDMEDTILQIYQALKPGGTFVFSTPHPSMIYCHNKASVFHLDSEGKGYYSSRNDKIYGQISTIDGTKLNIMSVHKTLGDYVKAINKAGFQIVSLEEAGVTEEHMQLHPEFFESVNDRPLHLVFKLKKPT